MTEPDYRFQLAAIIERLDRIAEAIEGLVVEADDDEPDAERDSWRADATELRRCEQENLSLQAERDRLREALEDGDGA